MPKRINVNDHKDEEYNYWTIISRDLTASRPSMFIAKCKCGNIRSVNLTNLKTGLSRSCGCLADEELGNRRRTHGLSRKKSKTYTVWKNMKARCYDPANPQYKDWGGRGITVCDRWLNSFENFYLDVGEAPTNAHTIERKDVDGDYNPENVTWATRQEQSENKRNTRLITYNGVTKTLTAWAKEYKMHSGKLHYNLYTKNLPFEEAIK